MDDRITLAGVICLGVLCGMCIVGTVVAQVYAETPSPIYGTAITSIISFIGGLIARGGNGKQVAKV